MVVLLATTNRKYMHIAFNHSFIQHMKCRYDENTQLWFENDGPNAVCYSIASQWLISDNWLLSNAYIR